MSYNPLKKISLDEMIRIAEEEGPASNAAFALFEAQLHDGPVSFYRQGNVFIVDRLRKKDN